MSVADDLSGLDRSRIREMFDLRSSANARSGAGYDADPNPLLHQLRESGPVHPGTVHDLIGLPGDWVFQGSRRGSGYSAFSYEACEAAFRNETLFVPCPPEADGAVGIYSSMFTMGVWSTGATGRWSSRRSSRRRCSGGSPSGSRAR